MATIIRGADAMTLNFAFEVVFGDGAFSRMSHLMAAVGEIQNAASSSSGGSGQGTDPCSGIF